jgi:RimJ/RimL family protein N-acetyltransferase
MIPSPFETECLRLRAFEPDDVTSLYAYLNQPDLAGRRYIPWKFPDKVPLSKQQVEDVIKNWIEGEKQFHLAITLRDDGTLIGHANCAWRWDIHCPSIDVVISPAYQQRGFGSEVLHLLLDYFFDNTQAHSISSGMGSWNQGALQFALKHGFKHSGVLRRAGLRDGQIYDWYGVDILRPEWLARSQKRGL